MALAKMAVEEDKVSLPLPLSNHLKQRNLSVLKSAPLVGHFIKQPKSDPDGKPAPVFYLGTLKGFDSNETYVFVRLRWDVGIDPTALQILIGYYWFPVVGEAVPTFLGFRFEKGVGDFGDGAADEHSYFHAQPCRNFCTKDDPELSALKVPNAYPAIGVNASNYDELFLQSILSISGVSFFKRYESFAEKEIKKVGPAYWSANNRVRESV